jgi:hypothetical protein
MTSEPAFEARGAAGSAHALTDRNDPTTAPVNAKADVFNIRSSPLVDAVGAYCEELSYSTNYQFVIHLLWLLFDLGRSLRNDVSPERRWWGYRVGAASTREIDGNDRTKSIYGFVFQFSIELR